MNEITQERVEKTAMELGDYNPEWWANSVGSMVKAQWREAAKKHINQTAALRAKLAEAEAAASVMRGGDNPCAYESSVFIYARGFRKSPIPHRWQRPDKNTMNKIAIKNMRSPWEVSEIAIVAMPDAIPPEWIRGETYVLVDDKRCVRIPLTRGMFSIIDEPDAKRVCVYKWCSTPANSLFYARAWIKSGYRTGNTMMHRFILDSTSPTVDHKNGNSLDNRRSNLREASHTQNRANSACKDTKEYKGVFPSSKNRWQASIKHGDKRIYLGTFSSREHAAIAYDNKSRELHGEFARPNIELSRSVGMIKSELQEIISIAQQTLKEL